MGRPGISLKHSCAMGLVLLAMVGCGRRFEPPPLAAREDPYRMHVVSWDSTGIRREIAELRRFVRVVGTRGAAKAPPRDLPAPDRVHPTLREWIRTRPPSDRVEVMVSFMDTVRIPRFPNPDVSRGRSDPANRAVLDTARMLVDSLRAHRAAQYAADTLAIRETFGGTVLKTFWLAQAALVRIRLDQVIPLSGRDGVIHIAPNRGEQAPQADTTVGYAKTQIGLSGFFTKGLPGPWITLLDTGVESRHCLLFDPDLLPASRPTRLCLVANLTAEASLDIEYPTGIECSTYDEEDGSFREGGDSYVEGHGTCSAGILVGNRRLGPDYQGVVPRAMLDCLRVYEDDRSLDHAAACRGMEIALERCNQVIVAEMDETTGAELVCVAQFAENAYWTGRAVIAANGNDSKNPPGVPASGRLVLGIGSYDAWVSYEVEGDRAHGPTKDRRLKPDVLAPTNTRTAAMDGEDPLCGVNYYSATSGATPYAAGVAAVLQQLMAPATDPGQTYALMILAGSEVGPFSPESPSGAGAISLPPRGLMRYGKAPLSPDEPEIWIEIPAEVFAGPASEWLVQAAIWWPEPTLTTPKGTQVDTHNDVDLHLMRRFPFSFTATPVASSDGPDGVFERVEFRVTRPWWRFIPASYSLRIRGKAWRTDDQDVYWAVAVRPRD